MLELDCHITKDGHVVVLHDEDLLRTTGHSLDVRDVLYKVFCKQFVLISQDIVL